MPSRHGLVMQKWVDFQNALLQGAGPIRDVFQQQAALTGVHLSVNQTSRAPAGLESIRTEGRGVIGAHGSSGVTLGQMQRFRGGVILPDDMRLMQQSEAFRLEQGGLRAAAEAVQQPVLGQLMRSNYVFCEKLQTFD